MKTFEKVFEKKLEHIFARVYACNIHPYPEIPILTKHLEARHLLIKLTVLLNHPLISPGSYTHVLTTPKSSWEPKYAMNCDLSLAFIEVDEVITDASLSRFPEYGEHGCDVVAFTVTAFGRTFVYEVPIIIQHNRSTVPKRK